MKRNKIILVSLIITFCIAIFWFIFSSDLKGVIQSDSEPIHHYIFTEVLKGNIDENGMVNYNGVFEKKDKLDEYLSLLSSHHPNISWTKKEQKAYWINAYNAFTIQLVLNNYPLKSIKDLGGIIYRVNTSWDIEFIEIEGQLYDLNDIEHNILRSNYADPRIHFALNCASISCPALRFEAYEALTLDDQLNSAGKQFLADSTKNRISKDEIEISRVFSWFTSDFTQDGELIDFLNKFSPVEIFEDADIDYLEYNWKLNEY